MFCRVHLFIDSCYADKEMHSTDGVGCHWGGCVSKCCRGVVFVLLGWGWWWVCRACGGCWLLVVGWGWCGGGGRVWGDAVGRLVSGFRGG